MEFLCRKFLQPINFIYEDEKYFIGAGSAGKPFFDLRTFFIALVVKDVHFFPVQFQCLHVEGGFQGDDEAILSFVL